MKTATKLVAFSLVLTLGLGLLFFIRNNYLFFSVQSGSMAPQISTGALVLSQKVDVKNLRVGDVVTYTDRNNPKKTITHRITELNSPTETKVTTKGDANLEHDKPIMPQQILGVTKFHIPIVGYLIDFIRRPVGLVLIIYLPALYVIIAETRLLIRKLIELEQSKTPIPHGKIVLRKLQPQQHHLSPHIVLLGDIHGLRHFAEPEHQSKVPTLVIIRRALITTAFALILPVFCVLIIPASQTFASLSSQVQLSGTNIHLQLTQISPSGILLRDVRFRCHLENTPQSSRRPRIVLHNPTNQDIIATNWHLDDNSGRMVTLPPNTRFRAKKKYVVTPLLRETGTYGLQYEGDFIALYNNDSQLVDGVSWGNNTSIMNPSIPNIQEGTRIHRTPSQLDTNTASDWIKTDRQCQNNNSDRIDPSEPNIPTAFTITELQTEE